MVTGISKAWIGINNAPNELTMGTGRKEVVLYDHTVAANINLTAGNNDCYYQRIDFPKYTKAIGDEHYSYIYAEYIFIGDAYGIPKSNGYPPGASASISYGGEVAMHVYNSPNFYDTFYFNQLSSKSILVPRTYGVYGDNTYEDGVYTLNFNIYEDQYPISVRLGYKYTLNTTIYNNTNIRHRVRIVGVI